MSENAKSTNRLFGIIGYPLAHSFSLKYFNEKFQAEHINDASFTTFPIENIAFITNVLSENPSLKGFAITIPHKKAILDYLDDSTAEVKAMGACNCVQIKDGKLKGYNSDVLGFELSFKPLLQPHHTHALILGSGGAAAAVKFILSKLGIQYLTVSRNNENNEEGVITYTELNESIMDTYSVIINTTPLGTFPKVEEAAAIPYNLIRPKHYLFDLVYNPAETTFLRLGKEQGATIKNGYDMLILQAEANWKIWNS